MTNTIHVALLTAKHLEESCRTAVAITTAANYAMFAFLNTFITNLNPNRVQANMRSQMRATGMK